MHVHHRENLYVLPFTQQHSPRNLDSYGLRGRDVEMDYV